MDTLNEIIDVAISVLEDYEADAGESRIARLASWLVFNMGVNVQDRQLGPFSRMSTDDSSIAVLQMGERVVLVAQGTTQTLSEDVARQLATALLIATERAESFQS